MASKTDRLDFGGILRVRLTAKMCSASADVGGMQVSECLLCARRGSSFRRRMWWRGAQIRRLPDTVTATDAADALLMCCSSRLQHRRLLQLLRVARHSASVALVRRSVDADEPAPAESGPMVKLQSTESDPDMQARSAPHVSERARRVGWCGFPPGQVQVDSRAHR